MKIVKNTGDYDKIKHLREYPVIAKITDENITLIERPIYYTATTILTYPLINAEMLVSEIYTICRELIKQKIPAGDYLKSPGVITNYAFMGEKHAYCLNNIPFYKYVRIIDYFQEKCRIQCLRNDQVETVEEFFLRNKDDIEKKAKKPLTSESIYNAFYEYNHVPCSEFDPLWAFFIYEFFKKIIPIKSVLDMSAGRGSRMVGAIFADINYTGVDPADCVSENYETMKYLFSDVFKCKKNIKMHKAKFEEFEINEKYDLMFSSPPYFDLEIFEKNNAAQSINNFSNIDVWLKNFMHASMCKISGFLNSGGIMAINIDNPLSESLDYVNPMLNFTIPNMRYIGVIQLVRRHIPFSVWCWQKN